MSKAAKVKPEEYTDPEATNPEGLPEDPAAEVKAKEAAKGTETKATEEPEAPKAGTLEKVTEQPLGSAEDDGWELGKPAPKTMYLDYDTGEVTETEPVRATVIVNEGHQVTPYILRQIKGS
jgi:hypothetical protein